MKRYDQIIKEAEILSRLHKDLNVWTGEINKSQPSKIRRGSLIKTIDSYKTPRGITVRIIEYNNDLYYVDEDIFYNSI